MSQNVATNPNVLWSAETELVEEPGMEGYTMSRLLAKSELQRYVVRRRQGTDKLVSPARTKEIAKRSDS